MKKVLFSELDSNNTSKENRQNQQARSIIKYLSKSANAQTIPEIAEHVSISIPTSAKLVKELLDQSLITEEGKKESKESGRKPSIYTLNKNSFYTIGVEVLSKWIHVSVVNLELDTVYETFNRQFILKDTKECLDYIITFIQDAIAASPATEDQIIGAGIAMTGSVNGRTSIPAEYFNSMDLPVNIYLQNRLDIPVSIDNDTRAIGISEQVLGKAKGVENVLIVKYSRDLGLSIILDKEIIFGAHGFAGNFGHLQFGNKKRLCTCGKKNCLRTEVSGNALLEDLTEALNDGETSIFFKKEDIGKYKYHDIFDAVLKGDALSIQLLNNQGNKLGEALGNIVNLLNPNLIVLGGEVVMIAEFIIDAVKAGMRKTGLVSSLTNCEVEASELSRYFSSRGAACMVLKNYGLINY